MHASPRFWRSNARIAMFLEKQCTHCHGEDGTGGVNLARPVHGAEGVFISIAGWQQERRIHPAAWREVPSDQEIGRRPPAFFPSASQNSSRLNDIDVMARQTLTTMAR
jgi:hypothetical protein